MKVNQIWVLYYPGDPSFRDSSDLKGDLEFALEEAKKIWPAFNWKVAVVADAIRDIANASYNDGYLSGERDANAYD